MSKTSPKVLIISTSRNTRGGVTAVVKAYERGSQWTEYQCRWIETHIDKGKIDKLIYFLKAFFQFVYILPSYDLVHIHTSEPPSAFRKTFFLFFAKLFHKKTIIHFHSFSPETTINSKYKFIYNYLFNKSDCVIVLSEYWKNTINSHFGLGDKVRVLYNPCREADYTKNFSKQKHILYAGTINSRKGYADLERAFAKISHKYPEWKVVFAGNGEIERALSIAKELKIEQHVEFLGWIDGKKKSKAFQEATIFCLPSYAEGFPMSVLDAWAYKLPVITTPVGGLPDILKDGDNALIFQPGDIDNLTSQLEKLISNEGLRTHISNESAKLAETTFNPEFINAQLGQIYSDILSSHN